MPAALPPCRLPIVASCISPPSPRVLNCTLASWPVSCVLTAVWCLPQITGFLGAGKTTLVNHILQGDHGLKIAVIENEVRDRFRWRAGPAQSQAHTGARVARAQFGEVSIDDALVAENMKTKENVVVMDNGCVCCTVRGDLIRALADINKKGPFDSVLLETTGLADPTPVALSFYKSAVVNMNFKLDAIVCLVDAKHVMQHLTEVKAENAVNESVQQVAFSDKIIVNKKDLVTPEELEDVVSALRPAPHLSHPHTASAFGLGFRLTGALVADDRLATLRVSTHSRRSSSRSGRRWTSKRSWGSAPSRSSARLRWIPRSPTKCPMTKRRKFALTRPAQTKVTRTGTGTLLQLRLRARRAVGMGTGTLEATAMATVPTLRRRRRCTTFHVWAQSGLSLRVTSTVSPRHPRNQTGRKNLAQLRQ